MCLCRRWEIFIFHPILIWFLSVRAFRSMPTDFLYNLRIWTKTGQSIGGRGNSILYRYGKILFFIRFWRVFCKWFLMKKCNKSYFKHFFVNVFCIKGVKFRRIQKNETINYFINGLTPLMTALLVTVKVIMQNVLSFNEVTQVWWLPIIINNDESKCKIFLFDFFPFVRYLEGLDKKKDYLVSGF